MFVGRNTRILGFSVAPEIAEEYDRLAQRQKKSKSELFRQMVESYKAKLDEEEFFRLQTRMARRAQKKRIFTEKEVEKIVFLRTADEGGLRHQYLYLRLRGAREFGTSTKTL